MTPTKKKGHPAIGEVLRFEGHDYRVAGHPVNEDGTEDERFLEFVREDERSPNKTVTCNTADVKDSGDGFYYLPGRVGPPLGGDENNGKTLSPAFPAHLREQVRSHPDYIAGRDDQAAEAVAKANKVDWPVHVSDKKFATMHTLRDPKVAAEKAAAEEKANRTLDEV